MRTTQLIILLCLFVQCRNQGSKSSGQIQDGTSTVVEKNGHSGNITVSDAADHVIAEGIIKDEPSQIIETRSEKKSKQKHALIITISGYNSLKSGWGKVHSHNDVGLMKAALSSQGFQDKNIMVLEKGQGTYEGIRNAFKVFENRLEAGDVAVIHFSSHGQQITDDNGDEVDGFDEAIVPLDALSRYNYNGSGYNGENHLRDDEIRTILTSIRSKLTASGNVFLVVDACHSGTASRGLGTARGTSDAFRVNNSTEVMDQATEEGAFDFESSGSNLASIVSFYGTRAGELNYETTDDSGKKVGSLSYALSRALVEADANTSYEKLFSNVKTIMARKSVKNVPQKEGDLNQVILGGNLLRKAKYFTVVKYEDASDILIINAGKLHGVYEGSVIAFYPPDTRDPAKADPLATGSVVGTTHLNSEVRLNKSLDESTALQSWAYVKAYALSNMQETRVALVLPEGELKSDLTGFIEERPYYELVDTIQDPNLIVEATLTNAHSKIQVYTYDDQKIFERPADKVGSRDVECVLLNYVHSELFRETEISDANISVDFKLIPVKNMSTDRRSWDDRDIAEVSDNSGNMKFAKDDWFRMTITNTSSVDIYFSVLDIYPTGEKSCLVPDGVAINEADCTLPPGASVELPKGSGGFRLGPPYGKETLKVIVADQPFSICQTVENCGAESRGAANPLERLMANTYKMINTRGAAAEATPSEGVTIKTVTYLIEE